jgi:radical SAM protein with 4Fe4S-binding SPASM domain
LRDYPNNFELKIEITERCNSLCSFCHQGYGSSRSSKQINLDQVVERLQWATEVGIQAIRFTGGEPLLHRDLEEMVRTANRSGFFVTINTNGLSSQKKYDLLNPYVDMYKISLPAINSDSLDKLTGVEGSFDKKNETIGHLLASGLEVQILSAIIGNTIGHLEKYVKFCNDIPGLTWSPLRLESSQDDLRPFVPEEIQALAEELSELMDKYPGSVPKLGLATPFCAVEPIELGAKVLMGRGEDCGPFVSLTVTPDNDLISCYSCRESVGSFPTLPQLQKDAEYIRLTGVERLPGKCLSCDYLNKCMGGCAAPEATMEYDAGEIDYLGAK